MGSSNTDRTDGAPLLGVVAVVRRAHLAVRALRLGEAALWSLATFAATLALVAHLGPRVWERDGFVLAGLVALCVFVALVHSTLRSAKNRWASRVALHLAVPKIWIMRATLPRPDAVGSAAF